MKEILAKRESGQVAEDREAGCKEKEKRGEFFPYEDQLGWGPGSVSD